MELFLGTAMNHEVQDLAMKKNLALSNFGKLNLVVFLEMMLLKNSNRLQVAHSGLAGYVKQSQKHFTDLYQYSPQIIPL